MKQKYKKNSVGQLQQEIEQTQQESWETMLQSKDLHRDLQQQKDSTQCKDISLMDAAALHDIKLVVFDVDGVLVPRGTKIQQKGNTTILETKKIARRQIEQIKDLRRQGYLVNISSGRSLSMLQDMFREIMADVSITFENGSATWYRGVVHQHVNSFIFIKDIYRDLLEVRHNNIKGFEPKEFIVTIHCEDRVLEIEHIMATHPQLYCLWNGEAYDIGVVEKQTKGVGLKRCIAMLDLEKKNVLAIGDNYNDIELLSEAGISVSADKTRVLGDFFIPLHADILPAEVLMDRIIAIANISQSEEESEEENENALQRVPFVEENLQRTAASTG
jgi:HAD superfamily hydrolase (TIGR01484 family)